MQFHEYANLFPMMSSDEFSGLVTDMQANGYDASLPIVTLEGAILDGRNRYKAAQAAGVAPVFVEYDGDDPRAFVIRCNLTRRHLNETQRAGVAAKLANIKNGGMLHNLKNIDSANLPSREKMISQAKVAEMLNVSPRTIRTYNAVAKAAPELVPLMESGEMTANEAMKNAKRKKQCEQRAQMVELSKNDTLPEVCQIIIGDFRDVSKNIPDNSVDIIFTDPPYDDKTIPLYQDMAIMAARVLKPGGSLITYVGHHALPMVLPLMTPHLRYWWTLCLNYASGPYNRLIGKNVFVQWKPLLWFVKGNRGNNIFVADRVDAPPPTKNEHDWQQGEVDYYIKHLCGPGGIVLDPFFGSGTTAIAAMKVGCRVIGIEISPETAEIAKHRIANENI